MGERCVGAYNYVLILDSRLIVEFKKITSLKKAV